MDAYEVFNKFFVNREKIREYKREGKVVIGTLCNTVPEEIVHSLGAVPVRLFGGFSGFREIYGKFPSWMCGYSRGVMEDALRGEHNFVDGVVSSTTDDTKIHLFSSYVFYAKPKFSYIVQYPFTRDEVSLDFFVKELERFAGKLSEFLGAKHSEDNLKKSIEVYNEFRLLSAELDNLRAEDPPKVKGSEFLSMMLSSQEMLKEDFNELLKTFLESARKRDGENDYKVRVHVSGTDFTGVTFFRKLEEWGLAIVSDDMCTSSAYYSRLVSGESLKDVARRYLNVSSCTLSGDFMAVEDRLKFIEERIESSKAEAVVVLKERGCEICGHQCSWIVKELNVPVLVLDYEYPISVEQYRTRVEAFLESFG